MTSSSSRTRRRPGKKSAAGIALACLAAAYTFLVPIVNEQFGWNLPQLNERNGRQVVAQETTATPSVRPDSETTSRRAESGGQAKSNSASKRSTKADSNKPSSNSKTSPNRETNRGPLADRMKPSASSSRKSPTSVSTKSDSGDPNLRYGLLRDLGGERYLSPSGLMYTRGSAEGHRLKHIERHTADIPNRPGSHGVFDGGMEGALQTIEKAYERAKKKQRTTVTQEEGRTTYVVDLGSRVGYVGGQTGRRKRNPMARRVKIVLEGKRVITAFPI